MKMFMRFVSLVVVCFGLCVAAARASYADVAAAVSAVQAIPTTATSTYLDAVLIGVGIVTIGAVVYVFRKGLKLRG